MYELVLRKVLYAVLGLLSGALVAAGMFAFITMIGVVTRMAGRTKTNRYAMLYEDMVTIGATTGNVLFLYEPYLALGASARVVVGFFAGVYVGCLAVALAEMLNVVPIFARRIRLRRGLAAFVVVFALGKLVGGLLDFFVL
ncbi:MAG: stage V sporulation protein AB [Lachnospiraceae bacterium]|nr:stage V sporulation protein AB [Lachnospiraceae bacterium]